MPRPFISFLSALIGSALAVSSPSRAAPILEFSQDTFGFGGGTSVELFGIDPAESTFQLRVSGSLHASFSGDVFGWRSPIMVQVLKNGAESMTYLM